VAKKNPTASEWESVKVRIEIQHSENAQFSAINDQFSGGRFHMSIEN
jgi:hypothetical protein